MNSSGAGILAAPRGDLLVSSPDGGNNWSLLDCPGPRNWSAVAMAGTFQAAAEKGGQIWSNNQPGDNWGSCGAWDILGRRDWAGLALTPAGGTLNFRLAAAAAAGGGGGVLGGWGGVGCAGAQHSGQAACASPAVSGLHSW